MVNSIVAVFFYRLQLITTDLSSKMHEKSLALTLFSKLCKCRGPPKLPKTSLTHEIERQTDAGDATITSYIMILFVLYDPAFKICCKFTFQIGRAPAVTAVVKLFLVGQCVRAKAGLLIDRNQVMMVDHVVRAAGGADPKQQAMTSSAAAPLVMCDISTMF